eukprot:COSAG05_NODE_2698_length_2755_cov_1.658133_2_plen_106_part_00
MVTAKLSLPPPQLMPAMSAKGNCPPCGRFSVGLTASVVDERSNAPAAPPSWHHTVEGIACVGLPWSRLEGARRASALSRRPLFSVRDIWRGVVAPRADEIRRPEE